MKTIAITALTLASSLAWGQSAERFNLEYIDRAAGGNRRTSVTQGDDGTLYVGYTGCPDRECKINAAFIAKKVPGAKEWETTMIDRESKDTGWRNNINFDHEGNLHAYYFNHKKQKIRHAIRKKGSKKWTVNKLKTNFYGGKWADSTRLPDGTLVWTHMSYNKKWEFSRGSMTYSTYRGGEWKHEFLDSGYDAGHFTSATHTKDGRPVLGYVNGFMRGTFMVAEKMMDGSWDIQPVSTGTGKNSVGVDSDGFIHAAFAVKDPSAPKPRDDLWYATNAPDRVWKAQKIDGGQPPDAYAGEHPELLIDNDDGIHILYRETAGRSVLLYQRKFKGDAKFTQMLVNEASSAGLYVNGFVDRKGIIHFAHEDGRRLYYSKCEGCTEQTRR